MTEIVKPKLAMYWAASCGGCEIAVLNIHEKILEVDANFEIVFWPVAMDAKYKDIEAMERWFDPASPSSTAASATTRMSTSRRSCGRSPRCWSRSDHAPTKAAFPASRTSATRDEIVHTAYNTVSTDNPNEILPHGSYDVPEGEIHIPTILPTLKTLEQVVDVDYYMPGCPPESHQIAAVIDLVVQVLQGKAELPPKGSVIGAGKSTVCDECLRGHAT